MSCILVQFSVNFVPHLPLSHICYDVVFLIKAITQAVKASMKATQLPFLVGNLLSLIYLEVLTFYPIAMDMEKMDESDFNIETRKIIVVNSSVVFDRPLCQWGKIHVLLTISNFFFNDNQFIEICLH